MSHYNGEFSLSDFTWIAGLLENWQDEAPLCPFFAFEKKRKKWRRGSSGLEDLVHAAAKSSDGGSHLHSIDERCLRILVGESLMVAE